MNVVKKGRVRAKAGLSDGERERECGQERVRKDDRESDSKACTK